MRVFSILLSLITISAVPANPSSAPSSSPATTLHNGEITYSPPAAPWNFVGRSKDQNTAVYALENGKKAILAMAVAPQQIELERDPDAATKIGQSVCTNLRQAHKSRGEELV